MEAVLRDKRQDQKKGMNVWYQLLGGKDKVDRLLLAKLSWQGV